MAEQIAYDQIGLAYLENETDSGSLTLTEIQDCNSWTSNNNIYYRLDTGWQRLSIVFPEPYDVTGYQVKATGSHNARDYLISTDTTDGINGTWTSHGPWNYDTAWPSATTVSHAGIKGFRIYSTTSFNSAVSIKGVHVYGTRSTTSNTEVVEFWHPTLDQVMPGDWLDDMGMYLNGTFTKQFRLKNLSASMTASNVTLSTDVLDDAPQALDPEQQFDDGGAPANPLDIGSLSVGTISSVITYTVTKNGTSSLGSWHPRVKAEPGSWV